MARLGCQGQNAGAPRRVRGKPQGKRSNLLAKGGLGIRDSAFKASEVRIGKAFGQTIQGSIAGHGGHLNPESWILNPGKDRPLG
jgi:hypothetical protein